MGKRIDGIKEVAEMMNLLDEATRERIMGDIERREPEVARKIRDRMFTFEELLKIPSEELQKVLRLVPQRKLALALRGLSRELLALIDGALSGRAAEALRDEVRGLGPQRLTAVEDARHDLAMLVLKLAADGQVKLH